ncbi:thioredoxin domain-containing protein [Halomicrobium sp. LC1Hm]|uniref:DsbA family protein n=1 Tax=Halomicrobium sp. LC1Hm TaxID=2610902 RepID=UPI00129828A1|nr:thioredoxin domain-containing protein [Halomicrobium sp. LC1Hm]QGA82541.1 Protein-disulfide isomerase [Halomicrobium sp. LC1Hm]
MDDLSPTRRSLLLAGGAAAASLAGCLDSSGGGSEQPDGTATVTTGSISTPVAGDPEADVTVAVYEDFACPHCATFNQEVYPDIRSEYVESGAIRYEHHDFPLPVDQNVSLEAPNAARAVQDGVGDEAFFEYADLLFENQGSLGPDRYASLAREVDADPSTVKTAAVEQAYEATIEADREGGIDAGVDRTPTALVNGERVEASYEALSAAIDAAQSDST